MRAEKRFWIYAGLAHPDGALLVRKPQPSAAKRILLIGSSDFDGLRAPLAKIADDLGSCLHVDLRDATLRQWAENDWLQEQLSVFRPTSTFVALDPSDSLARQAVRSRIRRSGARELWLVPPWLPWRATRRYLPAPTLNAEGYALWAAQAVAMVK